MTKFVDMPQPVQALFEIAVNQIISRDREYVSTVLELILSPSFRGMSFDAPTPLATDRTVVANILDMDSVLNKRHYKWYDVGFSFNVLIPPNMQKKLRGLNEFVLLKDDPTFIDMLAQVKMAAL